MKTILVTGSTGFIGRNLLDKLRHEGYCDILEYNTENIEDDIGGLVRDSDAVIHLAATHRPVDDNDFQRINVGLTEKIVTAIKLKDVEVPIVLASSIHVHGDSLFGHSKFKAEEIVQKANKHYILRLTNLFGPYGRPYQHSVVATFICKIINGEPIVINDNIINLRYVGDVTDKILELMKSADAGIETESIINMETGTTMSIEKLSKLIYIFNLKARDNLIPTINSEFEKNLYETFLWYRDNLRIVNEK